jgi:hypothetical protein
VIRRGRRSADAWPRTCDGERAEEQQAPPTSSREEHAMMFAFALAIVGAVVIGSLEVIADVH